MDKSCSIFFSYGYISIAPTISSLAKLLSKSGYLVNIYILPPKDKCPAPGNLGENIRIIELKQNKKLISFFEKPGLRSLVPLAETIDFCLQASLDTIKTNKAKRIKKNINIGIDIGDSMVSLLASYFFGCKYLFLSLELRKPEVKFRGNKYFDFYKNLADSAYKKSECALIQDEERFQALNQIYDYQHPQVFYLPNSPMPSEKEALDTESKNFFRDKFHLGSEKFPCLLLQAGMINDVVLAKELAQAFASINSGCALIFHSSVALPETDLYIQSLKQINSKNLFLSLEPLPYEEVDRMFDSAKIGLAFYSENLPKNHTDSFNYTKISKASGKLIHYLKLGKPVIVNDINDPSSPTKLIEQYQCGISVKNPADPQEISSAIERILASYEEYSQNARACFAAEFDFVKKVSPLLAFMDSL